MFWSNLLLQVPPWRGSSKFLKKTGKVPVYKATFHLLLCTTGTCFTTHGTNAALFPPSLPFLSNYPWPSGAMFTLTPSRDLEVNKICSWLCSCRLYFWWGTVGCLSLMWCWGTAWHKFFCYVHSCYILQLYFRGSWCEIHRLWVCC